MFSEFAHDHGQPTPWEYMIAGNIGEAETGLPLKINAGLLVKATGTSKPEYICITTGNVASGDQIGVIPVKAGKKYTTIATEDIAAPVVGTKFTIAADGSGITATTTSGVAILDSFDGDTIKAGDEVIVRF